MDWSSLDDRQAQVPLIPDIPNTKVPVSHLVIHAVVRPSLVTVAAPPTAHAR
jgi:hypothetical protein